MIYWPRVTGFDSPQEHIKLGDLIHCTVRDLDRGWVPDYAVVVGIIDSCTFVVAKPTWWRKAYWSTRRFLLGE